MRFPNAIRKWQIVAYVDGSCIDLQSDFVGTWEQARHRSTILSEEYDGEIDAIEINSQGIMWQGIGKDGGLASTTTS